MDQNKSDYEIYLSLLQMQILNMLLQRETSQRVYMIICISLHMHLIAIV